MQILIAIGLSFLLHSGYGQKETQLDWAELRPILERLKLPSTKDPNTGPTREIEEADAKEYGPESGLTLFLRTTYFTKGRYRPRYWMRVEDYSSAEAAIKRATEYDSAETYNRLEKIYGGGSIHEKYSLRLWAVARGKRVYALTTDALVFERESLPRELKAAISKLPEK